MTTTTPTVTREQARQGQAEGEGVGAVAVATAGEGGRGREGRRKSPLPPFPTGKGCTLPVHQEILQRGDSCTPNKCSTILSQQGGT